MDNLFQNSSGERSEHPPRDMLLLFVDGELQAKEAVQLETHLEACWPCRVKTQKIQQAIADIIEFDEQVLTPRLVPPGGWSNFDRKLSQLAAASGKQSLSSRLFGSLGRFFPVVKYADLGRRRRISIALYASALLVPILALGFIFYLRYEPTVSASELLNNAINAQAKLVRSRSDSVVHQRFQVRRKGGPAHEESAGWEIWNDIANSRVRQFLSGDQMVPLIAISAGDEARAKQSSACSMLIELTQVLEMNHMDAHQPLSAASFQSWHNTLQRPHDEITKSKLIDGADALTLRTTSDASVSNGQIVEAMFVVRTQDWQPAHMRLNVKAENEERVYELTQDFSEVISLSQVNPAIFAPETVTSQTTPKSASSPTPSPAKANANLAAAIVAPPPVAATAEVEIEALSLLSQVGADLGEQISVKRAPGGLLHVTGIVDTVQRKDEIVHALGAIASNPAVRIEIQTVAEAVAEQTSTATATPSISVRQIEITGDTMAAEPELRAYFANKGNSTDEAIRQYAARMVSLSGGAMDHLWAMKRLLTQFSPDELRALDPQARAKWADLIRAHGRVYQKATDLLRRELQPVFFPGQPLGVHVEGPPITDVDDLTRAVNQLFELGSSNDQVVRSAFTMTSGSLSTTVLKTSQFWQMTNDAEVLAGRIGYSISR